MQHEGPNPGSSSKSGHARTHGNGNQEKYEAYVRYHFNHERINKILSATIVEEQVEDLATVTARLNALRAESKRLEDKLKAENEEIENMEERFQAKKQRMLQDSDNFNKKIRRLSRKFTDVHVNVLADRLYRRCKEREQVYLANMKKKENIGRILQAWQGSGFPGHIPGGYQFSTGLTINTYHDPTQNYVTEGATLPLYPYSAFAYSNNNREQQYNSNFQGNNIGQQNYESPGFAYGQTQAAAGYYSQQFGQYHESQQQNPHQFFGIASVGQPQQSGDSSYGSQASNFQSHGNGYLYQTVDSQAYTTGYAQQIANSQAYSTAYAHQIADSQVAVIEHGGQPNDFRPSGTERGLHDGCVQNDVSAYDSGLKNVIADTSNKDVGVEVGHNSQANENECLDQESLAELLEYLDKSLSLDL